MAPRVYAYDTFHIPQAVRSHSRVSFVATVLLYVIVFYLLLASILFGSVRILLREERTHWTSAECNVRGTSMERMDSRYVVRWFVSYESHESPESPDVCKQSIRETYTNFAMASDRETSFRLSTAYPCMVRKDGEKVIWYRWIPTTRSYCTG